MNTKAYKNHEMDMTSGPIFKKLVIYALPLIGTNLLQLLFNIADITVLGTLCGDMEVGAVGATNSLINLIVAVFVGLSIGASVVVSRHMGANDKEGAHKAVGTSVVTAIICGVFLLVLGITCSRTFLEWMDTPEELIDGATRYMTIYFCGAPIMLLYNFVASILRAVGDTLRPLIYLLIGGVLNIGLNIFCITVLDLTIEGVALATVASQLVSVVLSLIALFKSKGYGQLNLKYLKIYKEQLKEIALVGFPSGLQGACFNIANVLIQSNINAFGPDTVTANTISQQFDSIIGQVGTGIALSCMAFVGQNYGAKRIDRIMRVFWQSVALVFVVSLALGGIMILLDDYLLGIMTKDPVVLEFAKEKLLIMGLSFWINGIASCFSYSLRALDRSILAMIISLVGICGIRILWINSIFLLNPTRLMLYLSYTVSYSATCIIYCFIFFPYIKKIKKRLSNNE